MILRPSIVVGHSRDGRYAGRAYGAYQLWTGLCRFLCDEHREVIHAVAPDLPLNFVHQDAVESMETCLRWFLARNGRAQRFMAQTSPLATEPRVVRVPRSAAA